MKKGTVKFFNDSKGFGFIVESDKDKEHFVHVSGLVNEINEGDTVEFELKEGRKGLNAVNVKVIDGSTPIAREKISGKDNHLSLYFDLDEFDSEEISEIILNLSDIYSCIGGDRIVIKGMQQLQYVESIEPQLI